MFLLNTLQQRFILEIPQKESDGEGGEVLNWVALGAFWAELSPLTINQSAALTDAQSRIFVSITLRFFPNFPKEGRFLGAEGAYFTIRRVVFSKTKIVCFCEVA